MVLRQIFAKATLTYSFTPVPGTQNQAADQKCFPVVGSDFLPRHVHWSLEMEAASMILLPQTSTITQLRRFQTCF